MVAAEGRAREFEPARERLGIHLLRVREIAQLQRHRLGDVRAELLRIRFDQEPAASRIAEIEDEVDIDGRRARLGEAVDQLERRNEVEAPQKVDERLVARDVLARSLHLLVDLVVRERPEGELAPAPLLGFEHFPERFEAPVLHPGFREVPVGGVAVTRQRELSAVARILRRGREIGFVLDEFDE